MPNIKSAIKRVKKNEARNAQNASVKASMRTAIKKFETAVENNEGDKQQLYTVAVKKLDKAVSKGLIHKNTSNRQKSRLTKKLQKANA
ncbi:30S ribosomal protein S20 [Bacillus chungangensis]|uniref:Small ribosomal subunit protein bS20 n=1 Tax=Bacillus chungangensis TaxID=587633 RepID=A0ABT9WLN7_9BACI|nr:30S ribosomal protein S20 [Bacillus chungangensis]MDQ0174203.1 small subunit ribosomal protein S20 [Bacillus chungangensis]